MQKKTVSLPTKPKKQKHLSLQPLNWLPDTTIYNKKMEVIEPAWLLANADILVLLFTAKGVDKDGIIHKFYEMYENVKYVNLPIEVIYVPMDKTEEEMMESYKEQANWFTLKFDDPQITILKYLYEVTCMPHIVVTRPDGTLVSSHGVLDLETDGKNAVLTWTDPVSKKRRQLSKEVDYYGKQWKYMKSKP